MSRFSASTWIVSGWIVGLVWVAELRAQSWLPPSQVKRYQVESQFGPREVVLAPRFPRDDKVELMVGVATLPFGSLSTSQALRASVAYHINRRHWVELVDFQSFESSLTGFSKTQLRDKVPSQAQSLTIQVPNWSAGAAYFFSPYYSKMHLGRRTVAHFDAFVGAGIEAREMSSLSLAATDGDTEIRPGLSLATGLRFLFPSRWALRLDVRNTLIQAENFGRRTWTSQLQLGLGASVYFGAFPDPVMR
jgi:outer membrane beta-barrel protein